MSETANGAGAVGSPAVSPRTAGDAASAANMPSVPAETQRGRLSDFLKDRREGKLPVQAPREQAPQNAARSPQQTAQQPQNAREHLAEKSRELEARGTESLDEPEQSAEGEQPSLADAEQPAVEVDEQTPEGSLSDADIIAKYREWEQSDLAPEEIFADKLHAVKVRGQERYVDYGELRQGYMRHGDYQARGNELKQREAAITANEQSYKQHFEAVKDPEQMLEIYERNGYGETLEKVAERIAQRRVEHRSLVIAAGRAAAERLGFSSEEIRAGQADNHRDVVAAMQGTDSRLKQARSIEIENRKLSFERERFESERQAASHAAEVQKNQQTYARQLDQLRPGALKAHGVKDTQQNRVAFLRHLQGVISMEGLGQDGITRAQVMSAARTLREESDDRLQNETGQPVYSPQEQRAKAQADARRGALGPNRTGTGAGKPLQAQQQQARRPSEFAAMRRNGLLGK